MGWPRPHPGQPVEPRATQEIDEDRLGLVVHGVARGGPRGQSGSGARHRARASRFGPGPTSTRTARKPAPRRAATAATTSPSAAEPARRPWSTCTAVTSQPAATASASSASESGPPETAQVRAKPRAGNVHRPSKASASTVRTASDAVPLGRDISRRRGGQVRCVPPTCRDGGSRPWSEASPAPPTPGPAARGHRRPPRRG